MAAKDVIVITVVVFVFAVAFLISHYALNQGFNQMKNNTVFNESETAQSVLSASQDLTARFDYIVLVIFLALCLAMIITGWLVGGHPIFMFFYFIVIVIGVVLGAILANAWETISTNVTFITTLGSFPITDHIVSALPIYTTIIGFIGMVVMFAKPFLVNQQ